MKKSGKRIAFFFYTLLILAFLLSQKSETFIPPPAEPIYAGSFATNSLEPEKLAEPTEASFTYLGNAQRAPAPAILAGPLRELWRYPNINIGVHGASKASPAVDASGIYVGGDDGWFYSFTHAGELRWRFLTGANNMGIHGTALLDENYVYVGAYNGRLYCLHKATGRVAWVVRLAHAIGSSPLLLGKDLFISAEFSNPRNGFLLRIDASSGKVLWRSRFFREQVHSSPTLSPDGALAFVGDNWGVFSAFDSVDGSTVWKKSLGGPVKGTAVWHEGTLYVTSWGKAFFALRPETGEELWRVDLAGASQSSPAIVGDFAILGSASNGNIYGINLKKRKIVWQTKLKASGGGMASFTPVFWRNKEAAVGYCGELKLCVLAAASGERLATIPLPGPVTGVPTVFQGKVYVAIDRGPMIVLGP